MGAGPDDPCGLLLTQELLSFCDSSLPRPSFHHLPDSATLISTWLQLTAGSSPGPDSSSAQAPGLPWPQEGWCRGCATANQLCNVPMSSAYVVRIKFFLFFFFFFPRESLLSQCPFLADTEPDQMPHMRALHSERRDQHFLPRWLNYRHKTERLPK